MRIVFFGTPVFAVTSLEKLVKNQLDIIACVTAPDKQSGRGLQLQSSPVKEFCIEKGIHILQPSNLKDPAFIDALKKLNADLYIVVAFRMLPEQVWNLPPLGTYNLHASLLPKYRGAAPINWSIINGEKETGVTTFKLQQQIDTGQILFSEKVNISDTMNAGELHDVLMNVGAMLLLKTIRAIEEAKLKKLELLFIKQNESEVSHAPKLYKENYLIAWNKSTHQIYNLIRGLSPSPGAFSFIKNESNATKQIKIFACNYKLLQHKHTNGFLHTDNKSFVYVYCIDGVLELTEIQLEGKKRMKVEDFLKGYKFKEGDYLSE